MMEFKDWMVLFIPIVFNGLFLFIFQQIILSNQRRATRKNDYQHDVMKQFLEMLQKFYTLFRIIPSVDPKRSGKVVDFSEVWNPTTSLMQDLKVFYDTHPVTTRNVSEQFEKCMIKWDKMTDLLFESRTTNDNKISEDASIQFCSEYEIMDTLIKECLKQCEEEILKI